MELWRGSIIRPGTRGGNPGQQFKGSLHLKGGDRECMKGLEFANHKHIHVFEVGGIYVYYLVFCEYILAILSVMPSFLSSTS